MLVNLHAAIERIKTGRQSEDDIQIVTSAIQSEALVPTRNTALEERRDAVIDSSLLTGNKNISGNNNIVIYTSETDTIGNILARYASPELVERQNNSLELEVVIDIVRRELSSPKKENENPVAKGLDVLIEFMKMPDVFSIVANFHVTFQMAREQIHLIDMYKALHDLLHTLEFRCYNVIIRESTRFPDDEIAVESLKDYEMSLHEIILDLQEIQKKGFITSNENLWLMDLKRAQEDLHKAVDDLDVQKLNRAIRLLGRVLAIQPSRINTNLNTAAKALKLPSLVNVMTTIWEYLSTSNLNRERFCQFEEGVRVFAELNNRLTGLVLGHDYWQSIDLELRRVEANVDNDLLELELSWLDLKERTSILFNQNMDEWAETFWQSSQNLDFAIKSQNSSMAKSCFRMYRRHASARFYQVDVTLKHLCEELRDVGAPLESILRMIE